MEQHSGDRCPACGAQVSGADNFCEKCGHEMFAAAVSTGSAVAMACRNCGSAQITADGYCEQCGQEAPSARDHVEIDLGRLAGVSDRGRRHLSNEDAMGLALTETPGGTAAMAVVCDGVSTSARPAEASLAAAQAALGELTGMLRGGMRAAEALPRAVLAADAAVRDLAGQSLNAPAATMVSAVVTADAVVVAWIGDSRAYWLPADHDLGNQLLTRDDSLAVELAAAGALPAADAITSPHAHIVTRWLGADAEPGEPHSEAFQPPGPGVLLLCTDGLWNYQPEADGLARLAGTISPGDLASAAAALLAFALEAGGQDNVTIVLIAFPPTGNGALARERSMPP
jgi:serine/threonine protein phosphatase PrpC